MYICKVVISDDLEGQNEASVELLVLGRLTLLFKLLLKFARLVTLAMQSASVSSFITDTRHISFLRNQAYSGMCVFTFCVFHVVNTSAVCCMFPV